MNNKNKMKNNVFLIAIIICAQIALISSIRLPSEVSDKKNTRSAKIEKEGRRANSNYLPEERYVDTIFSLSFSKKARVQTTPEKVEKVPTLYSLVRNFKTLKTTIFLAEKEKKNVDALKKRLQTLEKEIIKKSEESIAALRKLSAKYRSERKNDNVVRIQKHVNHLQRIIKKLQGKAWVKADKVEEIHYRIEKTKIHLKRKGADTVKLNRKLEKLQKKLTIVQRTK